MKITMHGKQRVFPLNDIKKFISVMETHCVFFEAGIEFLDIIRTGFGFKDFKRKSYENVEGASKFVDYTTANILWGLNERK
jgi:hypothetical protein